MVTPTVVATKTTITETAIKKPIEPKADVVTVAKFSETGSRRKCWCKGDALAPV